MHCYGITDVGKIRSINEDNFAIKTISDDIVVAVVADGMGGHNAGEVASSFATEEIIRLIEEAHKYFSGYTDKQIGNFLKNAVNKISKAVYNLSLESKDRTGMGTTMVVCIVYNQKCYIANVGDSRFYKYNGELLQITKDHSYVSELVEMGAITAEEAKTHPNRNVITKAVGTEPSVIPDIFIEKINSQDIFLMCSDGLSGMVSDSDISAVISENINSDCIHNKLVELANKNGGKDNITVVLLDSKNGGDM